MADTAQNIRERTFRFACDVARLAMRINPRPGARSIIDQLVRSATSIGANLEEAKAAGSDRAFLNSVQISLRESRETVYWLRVCLALNLADSTPLQLAIGEGDQIARIRGAIVVSKKRRMATSLALFAFCILNFALRAS